MRNSALRKLRQTVCAIVAVGVVTLVWAQEARDERPQAIVDIAYTTQLAGVPESISSWLPETEMVGSAPYRYMIWDVYDIALYAPSGEFDPDGDFALALKYKRDLSGEAIADRSSKLMREMGCADELSLAAWHNSMKKIFPDVGAGSLLVGVRQSMGKTMFLADGKPIGKIEDPGFGPCFFGIWLGEKTTEPALRTALLGDSREPR